MRYSYSDRSMTKVKHEFYVGNEGCGTAPLFANSARRGESGYSREVVLLLCLSLLAGMFIITGFVSRTYHKRIHTLADQWFAQGNRAFQAGDYATAVADFRNALVYSPANLQFQFYLAQGLGSSGNYNEAQAYLLNLLSASPGSGDINLALARIAARSGSTTDAMRYYNGAIYGVWDKDPIDMRWDVRFELCKYLLDRDATAEAQPELIALAQEVPPLDLDREKKAGTLLLRASLWDRALTEFRLVLASSRRDPDALAGAGRAEYGLGRYAEAVDYFERLPAKDRQAPEVAEPMSLALEIQAADPFIPRLSTREQVKRTLDALAHAQARIADCAHERGEALSSVPPATTLETLSATNEKMKNEWSERGLQAHPDRVEAAMTLVFEMEDAATQGCAEPQLKADKALVLIGKSRGGSSH